MVTDQPSLFDKGEHPDYETYEARPPSGGKPKKLIANQARSNSSGATTKRTDGSLPLILKRLDKLEVFQDVCEKELLELNMNLVNQG